MNGHGREINVRAWPARAMLVLVPLSMAAGAVGQSAPLPVIRTLSTEGSVPFAVHVHAVDSTLGAGSPLTARYEWEFDDDGSAWNTLPGFNAAHIYDEAGTYTVTLRITNEAGLASESQLEVTVWPDTRSTIYVSTDGHDGNSGTSPSSPVASAARAFQLLDHDTSVLFRRGDEFGVYGSAWINRRNVRLGAWGTGADPVLRWRAGTGFSGILDLGPDARAVVIEDLRFDSIHDAAAQPNVVNGIYPDGENITVRRCTFGQVSYAINGNRRPAGLLTQENSAGVLGAYYVWGEGSDHTHLGNTVGGSSYQHNLRFVAERVLLVDNDLANTLKSTTWFQAGSHGWTHGNILRDGPAVVGPIPQVGRQATRWRWMVMEANVLEGDAFKVYHGAEHVMMRNNVCRHDGGIAFDVLGWDEPMQRTSVDVHVIGNTAINHSTAGKFIRIGGDTVDVRVAANLNQAPNLRTGTSGASNAFILDDSLGTVSFRHNLWSEPAQVGWGDGWHYLWSYWSNANGYRSPAAWDALAGTEGETYRAFVLADLDASYVPRFDATVSTTVSGLFEDLYGNPRPASGPVTAGAVQGPAPDPGDPGDDGPGDDPGDDDGGDPDDPGDDSGDGPSDPGDIPDGPTSDFDGFNDDFETDHGWIVGSQGLFDGGVERGTPVGGGFRNDPPLDFDGSGQAYLTGNRPGDSDVDGGPAFLYSPLLDATAGADPVIHYAFWFKTSPGPDGWIPGGGGPGSAFSDLFVVSLSNDGGTSWVNVEMLALSAGGWQERSIKLTDHRLPTDEVRVRFSVKDGAPTSIVEAAVDAFRLSFSGPLTVLGDVNADGSVDIGDLVGIILAWGPCPATGPCLADITGDGTVDGDDLNALMGMWE